MEMAKQKNNDRNNKTTQANCKFFVILCNRGVNFVCAYGKPHGCQETQAETHICRDHYMCPMACTEYEAANLSFY